jgi:hypothetical protein
VWDPAAETRGRFTSKYYDSTKRGAIAAGYTAEEATTLARKACKTSAALYDAKKK